MQVPLQDTLLHLPPPKIEVVFWREELPAQELTGKSIVHGDATRAPHVGSRARARRRRQPTAHGVCAHNSELFAHSQPVPARALRPPLGAQGALTSACGQSSAGLDVVATHCTRAQRGAAGASRAMVSVALGIGGAGAAAGAVGVEAGAASAGRRKMMVVGTSSVALPKLEAVPKR